MKNTKRNKLNQVFSAFLIIGFIVCSYFFSSLASQVTGIWGTLIPILVIFLFGLLLFYATRVGEGKAVKRFSLAVLLLVDIPALYIILATYIEGLPLHEAISSASILSYLATVTLGYAIPYTFFSGFELAPDEDEEETEEEKPIEGGLLEELSDTGEEAPAEEADEEAPAEESADEEPENKETDPSSESESEEE